MQPASEPIDVVRRHYQAIRDCDRTALLGTLGEDVEWRLSGPPEIPFAGKWQGTSPSYK